LDRIDKNRIIITMFIVLIYSMYVEFFPIYTLGLDVKSIIVINSNGVVNVTITLILSEGLNKVVLPVDPIPMTIIAIRDGEDIPVIYDEGYLYLYLDKLANISISYIANITIENNVFILNIKTPDIVELRISKEVILLSWPDENIVDIGYIQGMLTLWIRGPVKISYVTRIFATETTSLIPQPTSPITYKTPTSTLTIKTSTPYTNTQLSTGLSTSTTGIQKQITATSILIWLALILGVVSVGIGVLLYYINTLRKKRIIGEHLIDMLSDIDKAILKALETRGGSALQTELQNDVKAPRTTLWRHVKKLEKMGIVKIEKVGLQNRVKLVKKIKFD